MKDFRISDKIDISPIVQERLSCDEKQVGSFVESILGDFPEKNLIKFLSQNKVLSLNHDFKGLIDTVKDTIYDLLLPRFSHIPDDQKGLQFFNFISNASQVLAVFFLLQLLHTLVEYGEIPLLFIEESGRKNGVKQKRYVTKVTGVRQNIEKGKLKRQKVETTISDGDSYSNLSQHLLKRERLLADVGEKREKRIQSIPNKKNCEALMQKGIVVKIQNPDGSVCYKIKGMSIGDTPYVGSTKMLRIRVDGVYNTTRSFNIHGFQDAFRDVVTEFASRMKLTPQELQELLKLGDRSMYSK